jgi:hypothetical protein
MIRQNKIGDVKKQVVVLIRQISRSRSAAKKSGRLILEQNYEIIHRINPNSPGQYIMLNVMQQLNWSMVHSGVSPPVMCNI